MARTGGVAKPDKKLHGVEIDWTGHPVRDGRGYYGEPGNTPEPVKSGAFPPAVPSGPDDVSRRRFSPSEALRAEMSKTAPSAVSSVTYRDGAEVENVTVSVPPKKPSKLTEYWARIKADPLLMAQHLEKSKAGYRKWLAKRKAKQ